MCRFYANSLDSNRLFYISVVKMNAEQIDWNPIIQGLATAIPTIVITLGILYKFKNELCIQISELKAVIDSHIKFSERLETMYGNDLTSIKERLQNIILRNNLKI